MNNKFLINIITKKVFLFLFIPSVSFTQNRFKESSLNLDKIAPKEFRVVDIDIGNFNKDTIEYAVIIIKNPSTKRKVYWSIYTE